MNVYFGWTLSSGMPAVYVHLSGRDVDDAVLKANHVIEKDIKTSPESTVNNVTESSKIKLPVNKDVKVSTVSSVNNVAESPKLNLSAIIEAKVGKLVEAKIAELLGS